MVKSTSGLPVHGRNLSFVPVAGVEIMTIKREDESARNMRSRGGDVKRNLLLLGTAALAAAVAVMAQDQPAKTTPKKTAAGKSGSATKGKQVFEEKCSVCHNADSDAKKIGPGLKGISKRGTFSVNNNKVTDESLKTWIENGDSLMPPFKDVIEDQQIKDVIAYIKTL
jgi:cytochrome c